MNQAARDWIRLTLPFDGQYQAALSQQHFAVQIIALAGHHLIPRQPDDSNTSMDYLSGRSMLVGQKLSDHTRVALHLTHFEIDLLNRDDTPISKIQLAGKTWRQVFEAVKNYLSFWSQTADETLEHLPSLELGEWMSPDWHGAVLRHSQVLQSSTSNAQHRLVREFCRSGINLLAERSGIEIY